MKNKVCFARRLESTTVANCKKHSITLGRLNWQKSRSWLPMGLWGLVALINSPQTVQAQVTADETVGTEVKKSDRVSEIVGGTTQGENLFHSFQEFSLQTGETAFFNNSTDITNIVGRVTSSVSSNIDGLIKANGSSNLILINPNGINFGANARLSIGGSFLGSTADSVLFADGNTFSAKDVSESPLLTVSAPVGLQLGQNAAAIEVEGQGHNLSLDAPVTKPFNRNNVSGLKMQTGKTLGLVGGNINLKGGVIASERGRIELGSVGVGVVDLNFGAENLSLGYENVAAFENITLAQQSLVDVSGSSSGEVQIQGQEITIADGSVVLLQNLGNETSGSLSIEASKSLALAGISADGVAGSGLYTEALRTGSGGNIAIATPSLAVAEGASIIAFSSGAAQSGDIKIGAEAINVAGYAEINPNKFSTISAQAAGTGNAGKIEVETKDLTILAGGNIASVTGGAGTGSGGNITVNAIESINLTGVNPIALAPSQVTAGSGGAGKAGNVALKTKNLTVKDGGRVDASATATGDAGNLNINASESLVVTGEVANSLNPSLIVASANILDPQLRQLFGLPNSPSGNSGNVTLETPQLRIMDGAEVTVRNDGTGNAGNIQINADSIEINNRGGITAAVKSGSGGEVNLEVSDSLNLTSGGRIISDNSGTGDGGKITVAAKTLNISDRAFLTTTTFGSGKGGDISLEIADSININGTGFGEFQDTFQTAALDGSLSPGTRGTGIFIGTAANGVGGNLQIATNFLNLNEGGIIFSPIFTDGIGGNITVEATAIEIVGSALQIGAGVNSSSTAAAGKIEIATDRLMVRDGGTIFNGTFGDATGGDIEIEAQDSINLRFTPDGSRIFTGIYANTSVGNGKGGDITIKTTNLAIDDGFISSSTGGIISDGRLVFVGGGDGGNITLEVAETIEIKGLPTDPRFASGISSTSFTNGAAGNIFVTTNKLSIQDGSEIAATTIGSGDGGNININASDSVELFGTTTVNNMQRGGLVAASGRLAFPDLAGEGASGSIALSADSLNINNGASIDVQSIGTGNAGNLDLAIANTISLDDSGTISAATNTGTGGNINIEAGNIFWRGNSTTTTRAQRNADGGNINIQGRNLVVLESSQLTAGANMGRGGNIDIDAQGLFICNQCVASASSRLGIDGVVDINSLEPNSNLDIVKLPTKLTQPQEIVAQACSSPQQPNNSSLTISGRGGLPPRPRDVLKEEAIVSLGVAPNWQQADRNKKIDSPKLPPAAQNWYTNSEGVVILTAKSTTTTNNSYNFPDCHVR